MEEQSIQAVIELPKFGMIVVDDRIAAMRIRDALIELDLGILEDDIIGSNLPDNPLQA